MRNVESDEFVILELRRPDNEREGALGPVVGDALAGNTYGVRDEEIETQIDS